MSGEKSKSGTRNGDRTRPSQRRRKTQRRWWDPVQYQQAWNRLLERSWLWSLVFVVLGTWALTPEGLLPSATLSVGDIAPRDFTAPADLLLPDPETTASQQRAARNEVLPVYDLDPAPEAELDAGLARLFSAGRGYLTGSVSGGEEPKPALRDAIGPEIRLTLDDQQLDLVAGAGFSGELEERLRSLASRAFRRRVVRGKPALLENVETGVTLRNLATGDERRHLDFFNTLDFPEELRSYLEAELSDWREFGPTGRGALVDALISNLRPNLYPNPMETLARQEAASSSSSTVYRQVRKGQVVVRKGDEIDVAAARAIAEISGDRQWRDRGLPVLATFALLCLAILALRLGLRPERVLDHSPKRLFSEVALLLLFSFFGARLGFVVGRAMAQSFSSAPFDSFEAYAFALPFAALPLVVGLLFGTQTALLLSFIGSLLISRLFGADALWVAVYSVLGCFATVYALERFQFRQRLVMSRVGLVVGLTGMFGVLILACLGIGDLANPLSLAFGLVCAFLGGLLVAAVGSFGVPVLESVLSVTTDIKLVELANTNLPLLRRLAFEAPGTFQHSLMVANLAKEGCEAIGADPVLAYTGGLYHDIGKVFRPDYFIENQRPGQNRHDKLQPTMSALILISHVKDGVDLARETNLPKPLQDAIAQHHGTRLIKYFYNRALERSDPQTEEVREENFRYPGPKPQGKVMGVLLLADGVEAASRTLIEPTPQKIRTLIKAIVDDALRDSQLDDSDLTLSDIARLSRSFERVLTTIFHQRIDYPGFDFNKKGRAEGEDTGRVRATG